MSDEPLICSMCEGGPDLNVVCERCQPLVEMIRQHILCAEKERILAKLGVGQTAYVIVPEQEGSPPSLDEAFPEVDRIRGYFWTSHGAAADALGSFPEQFQSRRTIRKVIIHYVTEEVG